jgi:methionyl-tRNA formyltransferase
MMNKKLNIAFAGTPEFAIPSLAALMQNKNIQIKKIYTQPDKPAGRGKKITASLIKIFAQQNGLQVLQPLKIKKSDLENLDFLVVVAYGMILSTEILLAPKFGCVNLHASLLPKYRGASPIQSAILAGEKQTGITFMQISEQLDSGDIFSQYEISTKNKNAKELSAELAELGNKFPEILQKIANGKLQASPQDKKQATFCSKIKKEDGEVNWEKDSTEMLMRKLRAFTLWPSVWTRYNGKVLKLLDFVSLQKEGSGMQVGEVFSEAQKIFVKTFDGSIELRMVQLEGKREMNVEEFVRGDVDFVGSILG